MATSNSTMIRKLQTAINMNGGNILYNTSQFYSKEQQRAITIYHIKQAIVDEDTEKVTNVELFKSTSQIQIVLFLRDYWFGMNNWELPDDNPTWSKKRAELQQENLTQ